MKKKSGSISNLSKKLDRVLQLQKLQLQKEEKIKQLEIEEINEEQKEESQLKRLEKEDKDIERELKELEGLEQEIKKQVAQHPLRKISYKDLGKSAIGAFIGIVSHFTVLEGIHYAETITTTKANGFYIVALIIGLIMIYYTGFRKIRDVKILSFLPLRILLVYAVTIITILVVLLILGEIGTTFMATYRSVSALMLPAIIGACAADLIGE